MLELAALGCAILTFFMGVFHIILSMGLPIGEYVLGGKNKIIPKEKRYPFPFSFQALCLK